MSGIYLHIPFCKSKCNYCDFYSVTKTGNQDGFIPVLLEETGFRQHYLPDNHIDTIYFGGGTPTLFEPRQLAVILERLHTLFQVDPHAEITIEANPDDLDAKSLEGYMSVGFNRISIGTQSFIDEHLQFMNRRHDAAQGLEAVKLASEVGFHNTSIDLIYGIPGMTGDEWRHNLDVAAGLPADHISAYHLTIEPGTKFGKLKKAGLFSEIPDDQSLAQYRMLTSAMGAAGFEHYEISNFAREGRYSRHNSKYWMGESYLGLGPSAHSFNGTQRHWNPSSLTSYIRNIKDKKAPEGETIDIVMHRNEFVMTRLRTSQGILDTDFKTAFGEAAWDQFLMMADRHMRKGFLINENGRIFFNREDWFHSDGILSDLFLV
ncbi:MAG: radical SAM family heme chaperone HemW [Bacteroidales bacterium]